ncbi:MAG: copper oxidase, partial [Methyloceanibacter sp.]
VNLIGAPQRSLSRAVSSVAPGVMAMGTDGMGMMGEMQMPLPFNTLPMMTGFGQFGPIEMGGMFTVMKVREGLAANDYKDPGPYRYPPGTVAHEVNVAQAGEPARQPNASEAPAMDMPGMDMPGMKPGGHQGHN